MSTKRVSLLSIIILVGFLVLSIASFAAVENIHELVIMGTNDLHGYVMPYDYLTNSEVDDYGLAKTYTLVKKAREMYDNTVLFDAGDFIQGSVLAELEARIQPLEMGETPSIVKAMNIMGYDVAAIGNHEFNFGLEYLDLAMNAAAFPMLSANVFYEDTDELVYEPYTVLKKEVDGYLIKIGVISFLPPEIMLWDKAHLKGKVYTTEIADAAEKYVPMLQEEDIDILVVVLHQGSSDARAILERVDGIDAMLLGHTHSRIAEKIYGVPVTMAGSWGSHLGLIHLYLKHDKGEWNVIGSETELWEVEETTEAAPEIVEAVKDQHETTIEYVLTPIGQTTIPIKGYFARVMDNPVTQIVNNAQLWYARNYFEGTEYEDMPLLSAAAPFRTDTNVEEGDIRIMNAADIYIYSNTLHVVKVNGAELKGWLERCAENFNRIDPENPEDQNLLARFSAYNFDVIEGITYQIDVTKPEGERIVNLAYEGEPIPDDMEFLVVTNNYRSGGGGYHLQDANVIFSSTSENRSVIIDYIREKGVISPVPTYNWSIAPFEPAGRIIFNSREAGAELIEEMDIEGIKHLGDGVFEVDIMEIAVDVPVPTA